MGLNILIAEAHEMLRIGLSAILISDARVSEVREATHEKELQRYLSSYKADLIIVNQDLLADVSILRTKNFVVLATEPNITQLKVAYENGARGYLSINVSAELLRTLLRPTENAFLVEPTLVSAMMEFISGNRPSSGLNEALLTPREREIVRLLREGYDRTSIAKQLCIAEATLKTHIQNIAKKRTTIMLGSHLPNGKEPLKM